MRPASVVAPGPSVDKAEARVKRRMARIIGGRMEREEKTCAVQDAEIRFLIGIFTRLGLAGTRSMSVFLHDALLPMPAYNKVLIRLLIGKKRAEQE